jgi:dihydrofolate reductase
MPGRLVFTAITSLDGYVNDAEGRFDWSAPDADVHRLVNDLERPIGTYLYGRRLYDVMQAWETIDDPHPVMVDYAQIWRAADKVVYSTSLQAAATPRTRIERRFDPDAVRALKAQADRDLSVGGPTLAAQAFAGGLVDEVQLLLSPVVVGGGTRALPDGVRLDLELRDERRFANGVVYLRYVTATQKEDHDGPTG